MVSRRHDSDKSSRDLAGSDKNPAACGIVVQRAAWCVFRLTNPGAPQKKQKANLLAAPPTVRPDDQPQPANRTCALVYGPECAAPSRALRQMQIDRHPLSSPVQIRTLRRLLHWRKFWPIQVAHKVRANHSSGRREYASQKCA